MTVEELIVKVQEKEPKARCQERYNDAARWGWEISAWTGTFARWLGQGNTPLEAWEDAYRYAIKGKDLNNEKKEGN
jgi:hypothetical protein